VLTRVQHWWVSRYLRIAGRRFDKRHCVETSGWIDGDRLDGSANIRHATAYVGMPPIPFRSVMDQLPIDFEEFVFVDLGSGKGRALLLASEYPFAQITGVEFSPRLHSVAEANCRSYVSSGGKKRKIACCCMDASLFEIPPEPVVLFLFNPFGEAVMGRIAENLRTSLQRRPRVVFVVYFWPTVRKVWDEQCCLAAVHVRQPAWAWPAHRGREIVAVWSNAAENRPAARELSS
jgi:hypothetical protein